MIHNRPKKRHDPAQNTPRDSIPGHGGGGINVITGDQVVVGMKEDEDVSDCVRNGHANGDCPMDRDRDTGPGEGEEGARH